jgi:RNA polymerase sigma factor (sigma-70 family)
LGLFKKYSDSAIIEGLCRQDNKILEYLYDSYFEMVRDHLRKNSGSDDDVYDVLQESIVILYKQVRESNFRLTSDLKGYFFGIVKNRWRELLRKNPKLSDLDIDPPDDSGQSDENQVILERIVSRSFTLLKEDCQIAINLFMEGYNYEEIARKMGLKNETYARRKKYLCKEALMEIIKSDNEYQDLISL